MGVVAERRGITILNQIGFVCHYLLVHLWTKQLNVQLGTVGKTDPDMIYMEFSALDLPGTAISKHANR
jgi:hypothetical protein